MVSAFVAANISIVPQGIELKDYRGGEEKLKNTRVSMVATSRLGAEICFKKRQ